MWSYLPFYIGAISLYVELSPFNSNIKKGDNSNIKEGDNSNIKREITPI
jgi:hypothetical protein